MSATIGYYGGIVTDGLVLYLDAGKRDSYSGYGTNWKSVARGELVTGSLVNGPTFSSDSGSGIVFDGTNDNYSVNYSSSFSDHTIVVIAKVNNLEKQWIPIMEFSSSISGLGYAAHYYIVGNTNGTYPTRRNAFGANWQTTIQQQTWGSINLLTLTTNQTYMFTGRVRNGIGDTFQNLNKTKDSSNIVYNNIPLTQIKNARQNNSYYFEGTQYIVMVYNRGISDNEITQNYNALKGRFGLT